MEGEDLEDESKAEDPADDLDDHGTNINGGGDPSLDANNIDEEEEENEDAPPKQNNNKSDQSKEVKAAFGVQSTGGNESLLNNDNTDPDESTTGDIEQQLDNNGGSKGKGGGISQSEGNSGESKDIGNVNNDQKNNANKPSRKYNEPPNPFKEKGDINEKWHRRLNLVENDKTEVSMGDNLEENKPSDHYEHTKHDDGGTEQVLSDALEDDQVPIPTAGEMNDTIEKNGVMDIDDEDDSQIIIDEQEDKAKNIIKKDNHNNKDMKAKQDTNDGESNLKKVDASDEMDVDEDVVSLNDPEQMETDDNFNDEEDIRNQKIFSNSEFHFGRSGLNNLPDVRTLTDQQITGELDDTKLAYDVWFEYKNRTEMFSNRLCEQLRLVLEPTLATRLQGDYRNGKRINMRRVIPYVASGYRKDKIWLRRTKPAKRDYQVLIMIDDSSSMGDAGNLALSALCCISNALTRLEIGDLCVASFADTFKVLHSFGKPFTDEAGAKVFSQFNFTAGSTLLASSLEAVGPIFEAARSNSSIGPNSVILQLCFVISDARIDSENRDKLERTVRMLSEKHILVVLVIVDRNKDSNNSIFNTKTVSFKGNKVVTSSYFDSFPFPYYVAIQRPEVLPELLSDALRQWFELIRVQSGDN